MGTDTFTYTASDGTGASDTAVVTMVVNVHAALLVNPGTGGTRPANLKAFGDAVYFTNGAGTTTGIELWKTNGSDAGTVLVKDINPGSCGRATGQRPAP